MDLPPANGPIPASGNKPAWGLVLVTPAIHVIDPHAGCLDKGLTAIGKMALPGEKATMLTVLSHIGLRSDEHIPLALINKRMARNRWLGESNRLHDTTSTHPSRPSRSTGEK